MRDNPEGRISKKEFKIFYERFLPSGVMGQIADYSFNVFDRDGNGTIVFKEFTSALSIISQGPLDEKLKCASPLVAAERSSE